MEKRRVKAKENRIFTSNVSFRVAIFAGAREETREMEGITRRRKGWFKDVPKIFFTVQRFTICVVLLLRSGFCMLSKVLYRVCASSSCILKIYLFLLIT